MPIKRMRSVWLLLILLPVSMIGFGQTANITQGCVPLTVSFSAPPGSGPTYYWEFGDGSSANQQNPSNTFTDPGTYVVEFHNTSSGPVIGTVTINVYEQPVPEFTATPTTGCAPLNVAFTDETQVGSGVNILAYTWVFGDGGSATGSNPSHWFTAPGSYYVSLEIETNLASCNATEVYQNVITVTNGPFTNFTTSPNPPTACDPPLTVSFTNNSGSTEPLTYSWDFGNGNTSTDQSPAAQTYTQNGNYTVVLTATDPSGCVGTFQRVITIGSPTTAFAVPDTICIHDSIQMDNLSSAGFYQWVFALGNSPQISSLAEPWVHFDTPGLQNITLTTTSGQCSSSSTVQVLVEDPSAEFTSTPDYACVEPMDVQFIPANTGYAEYQWLFGDSATSSLVSPTHTYMYEDTTIYSWYGLDTLQTMLIVISSAGCRDTVVHTDTLWLPNAVFFPDVAEGCVPLTVTFADSSTSREDIVLWEWHLGDGTVVTSNDGSPQSVTYTQPGHYDSYLVIVNAAGCTDTSYNVTTIVGDQLNPSFTVDLTQVCPGDPVQFTNTTALSDSVDYWHYYSETNRQFHCFDDPNPTWSYTDEVGLQDVTLIVGWNGCYSSTTVNDLIQVDGPIAEILLNCECDAPFDVDFKNVSHDYTDFSWDFGDGNTSTLDSLTHTYAATGDYTIVLTVTNSSTGCPTSYDTATVHIRDIQAAFSSDSIFCEGVAEIFNATASQDVFSDCWGGYTYQFDDPTLRPITTPNANHPIGFANSGHVGVTLIVRDINGCRDTAHSSVLVYGIDAGFALSDTHICSPTDVTFTDQTTSDTTITSWAWSFGDLGISTDQNPIHTYNFFQDTLYVNMVAINAAGCVDTVPDVLITMYTPVSNVTTSPFTPNICAGNSVNFTATDYVAGGSNLSFAWDFDDNGTSQVQNPSHVFADGGTYQVTVTYTEVASGCTGTTSVNVNVQDYPIAGFESDADSLGVLCAPTNASFSDTSIVSGFHSTSWNYGNGTPNTSGATGNTVYNSGEYLVTMIVNTSYGCSDTAYQTIYAINPQGTFTIDKDTICRGETITFTLQDTSQVYSYFWDFGDGYSASNVNPAEHTYTFVPPSGQTVGKLVVSGLFDACPDQFTVPIYIHEVVADFTLNAQTDTAIAFCFQDVVFENNSLNADNFYWRYGFGQPSTVEEPGTITYPDPGTYVVSLGVSNNLLGCNDTMIKTLTLHPIPDIRALGDTICEGDVGDLAILDPEPTSVYTWYSDIEIADTNATNTTSAPLFTAQYEVAVVDTNGCVNADTTFINVINPLVLSNWDTTIVIGDSICLPMDAEAGLYIFEWTPTEGLTCANCASPCLRPLELVMYSVSVTDVLGCFTASADYTVDIYPETFLAMPTTFTPNGDGHNEVVSLEGWGIKELIEFKIFNRWGEELFSTTDKEQGWDGKYKGVLQNNDVYAYKIKATTWRDEIKTLEGYINLMR